VIDNIRELGLQEIGMRWASLEGVTYKDWSRYHELKKSFDTWRHGVEVVALKHDGIVKAKEEGEAVQEEALEVAGGAARELNRLKGVIAWKIVEHDSSEDFSSKTVPQRVVKAVKEVFENAAETVSEIVSPTDKKEIQEAPEITEDASDKNEDIMSDIESAVSEASATASESVNAAASSVSELFSAGSEKAESAATKVASAVSEPSEKAEEVLPEKVKVWGGAEAAFVEAKQVVLDDDFDNSWSDQISDMLDSAGDKAEDLKSIVSEALFKPTPTKGTVESVSSVASEQYAKAMYAASSVLFGTPQPATESIYSEVSDQISAALKAASEAVYGTPTPVYESYASQATSAYGQATNQAQSAMSSISSVASSRLQDGLSQASAQYTKARLAVGLQPPPLHEQYLSEAKRRYYEGLGVAHEQYIDFVSAASSAVYGTPTPYYQSLASEASAKIMGTPQPAYQSMVSAATEQYQAAVSEARSKLAEVQASASSMAGMSSDSPAEKVLASASSQYSAAFTAASAALVNAASSASVAVYGTEPNNFEYVSSVVSEAVAGKETPWTEEAAAKASKNFDAIIKAASSKIYGTPTPVYRAAWGQANEYAAQATVAAASQYNHMRDVVSELLIGKEPDFTESVMSRLQSAYYTDAADVAASASSYFNEVYGSASSVVSSVFTPPATLNSIIDNVNADFQAAVSAASVQIYGTTKGSIEQATSVAADTYHSAQSAVSAAIFGDDPSYWDAAQASLGSLASNAQAAASHAIYGTPTGTLDAAASSLASVVSQATSVAGAQAAAAGEAIADTYASVASQMSLAYYGPQEGSWESASKRISWAAASASAEIRRMVEQAGGVAGEKAEMVKETVESVAEAVKSRIKDEL
jgi:hypothetical protein